MHETRQKKWNNLLVGHAPCTFTSAFVGVFLSGYGGGVQPV